MPRRKMTQWFKDSRASKIKITRARKNGDWAILQSATSVLQHANKQRFSLSKNGRRVQVLETYEDIDEIKDNVRPANGRSQRDQSQPSDGSDGKYIHG